MLVADDKLREQGLHVGAVAYEGNVRQVRSPLVQGSSLAKLLPLAHEYVPAAASLEQADGCLVDVYSEYILLSVRGVVVEPLPRSAGLAAGLRANPDNPNAQACTPHPRTLHALL